MITPYSSAVRSGWVARRQWVIRFFPWESPSTMLVLPISMARSMDRNSILQRNHVAGINIVQRAALVFNQQRAVRRDAARAADDHLIEVLDPDSLAAEPEARFPPRPQSVEAGLFKHSIAPVEGVNQSRQHVFARDKSAAQIGQRSRARTDFCGHFIAAVVDVNADAEDHMLDGAGRASRLGQHAGELPAAAQHI